MSTDEEKIKKRLRIRSHIAKDLRSPKYHQRIVPRKREDDAERRYRRYRDLSELSVEDED